MWSTKITLLVLVAAIVLLSGVVSAATFIYDDFSTAPLNTSRWTEWCAGFSGECLEEHYVDLTEERYHWAQTFPSEIEDANVNVNMSGFIFIPGDSVEFDFYYNNGSGNGVAYTGIYGSDSRIQLTEIGYWNGVKDDGNLPGTYHYRIDFFDDHVYLTLTRPDGVINKTIFINSPGGLWYSAGVGHNGVYHWDWDNFLITTLDEVLCDPNEYPVDASTAALWHMNEAEGDTIYDKTDNHNDGTINGAQWTDGTYCTGLEFDGIDDYVTVPDSDSLDLTIEGTIEAWIKANPTAFGGIIGKAIGAGPGQFSYAFQQNTAVYGGRLRIVFSSGGPHCQEVIGTTPVTDNRWHHVAATWNGSTINIYIDGGLDASAAQICSPMISNFPLQIGELAPLWGDSFNGLIDEVRISNRARDPSEFNIPGDLSSLEERVTQLEIELNETKILLNQTIQRVDIIESLVNTLTETVDALSSAFNSFADLIISYLTHAPHSVRQTMLCGYMREHNLTSYSDLGLSCHISGEVCICAEPVPV